jgi:hypothetical protein
VCSNATLPPWLPDPAGERELGKIADGVVTIPDTHPRNLAKSVTFE